MENSVPSPFDSIVFGVNYLLHLLSLHPGVMNYTQDPASHLL